MRHMLSKQAVRSSAATLVGNSIVCQPSSLGPAAAAITADGVAASTSDSSSSHNRSNSNSSISSSASSRSRYLEGGEEVHQILLYVVVHLCCQLHPCGATTNLQQEARN